MTQSLTAQVVNIENRRVNDGTYGFSGALNLTMSAYKQKDLLLSVQFQPLIQYKFSGKSDFKLKEVAIKDTNEVETTKKPDKNKHMILLINDLKYTASNGTTYANFGMAHLRYAYRIANSAWKWESYAQIQYNQLLLQKVRTLVGTGFRVKMLDLKPKEGGYAQRAARLFMGTSVYYEYEEINPKPRPIQYSNTLRWSTYLSSYLNFKYVEFSSSTYIQPNTARFKDFRFSGDYALLFKVSKPFSIRLNYSHYYNSMPPEKVAPSTYSVSAGFVYKLDQFKIDPQKWEERRLRKLSIS
jgi:hypothetical protein